MAKVKLPTLAPLEGFMLQGEYDVQEEAYVVMLIDLPNQAVKTTRAADKALFDFGLTQEVTKIDVPGLAPILLAMPPVVVEQVPGAPPPTIAIDTKRLEVSQLTFASPDPDNTNSTDSTPAQSIRRTASISKK